MRRPTRIDQIVNSVADHDAVSTHMRELRYFFRANGFESDLFSEQNLSDKHSDAFSMSDYKKYNNPENILIDHHSIGTKIAPFLLSLNSFRSMCYHNITPPEYFDGPYFDRGFQSACKEGVRQLSLLRLSCSHAWTVSKYNQAELVDADFCNAKTFSVFRDYGKLQQLPDDPFALNVLTSRKRSILFVGRRTPHKAQHDLLKLLDRYRKSYGSDVKLVLLGGELEPYRNALNKLAARLELTISESLDDQTLACDADIWIPAKTSDVLLATCYRNASVFISMSEHEGFCVPLVEAMAFSMPVLAHDAAAIAETLGIGGKLVDKKHDNICAALHDLFVNPEQMNRMRLQARSEFESRFSKEQQSLQMQQLLEDLIEGFSENEG